jgi:thiosulfate dehydrogenase [quinone] large subunit
MSIIHRTHHTPHHAGPDVEHSSIAHRVLAVLRIGFGLTFLWAFFDKLLALGYHTGYDQSGSLDRFGDAAWINEGSPTLGFLSSADGPFEDFYTNIAGDAWADWLFMIGLLGIGIALTFGAGMRIAAATGALLYVLMWSVVLPPENNPVLDDHLLLGATLVVLALFSAGDTWGLGRWWSRTQLVQKYPVLR